MSRSSDVLWISRLAPSRVTPRAVGPVLVPALVAGVATTGPRQALVGCGREGGIRTRDLSVPNRVAICRITLERQQFPTQHNASITASGWARQAPDALTALQRARAPMPTCPNFR